MIRKGTVTLLAVIALLSLYLAPLGGASADSYNTGDYWEYEAEEVRDGLT